jgi:hypothetical protein
VNVGDGVVGAGVVEGGQSAHVVDTPTKTPAHSGRRLNEHTATSLPGQQAPSAFG